MAEPDHSEVNFE
jgi:hypothetical protein